MKQNIYIPEYIQLQKHPLVYYRIASQNETAALCNIIIIREW
jgi:hypothetical protein